MGYQARFDLAPLPERDSDPDEPVLWLEPAQEPAAEASEQPINADVPQELPEGEQVRVRPTSLPGVYLSP